MEKHCSACQYHKLSHLEEPCKYCGNHSEFKPRIGCIDEAHEWCKVNPYIMGVLSNQMKVINDQAVAIGNITQPKKT